MLDEHGREMHGSWGNMIEAEEAFERMGADVMRWQFCAQPPDRNLLFGYGPAHEIKRRLLTLWNSVKFLVDYANIEGFRPTWDELAAAAGELRPLDRWLRRADARARRARRPRRYEAYLTVDVIGAFEASSTTSRTGTSAARGGASGTATGPRSTCSGTRSSRRCASSRR